MEIVVCNKVTSNKVTKSGFIASHLAEKDFASARPIRLIHLVSYFVFVISPVVASLKLLSPNTFFMASICF